MVESVGANIGQRRVPLVAEQALLLIQGGVGPADMHAPWGHREVLREDDANPLGADIDAGGRLDHLLDRLHAGPDPGKAAHCEGVQAQIQDVLNRRRKKHRQTARLEDVVALVCRGAALGDMIVAGHGDHAAMACGACHVGMLEDIGTAVHPRTLPVPDPEDAIVLLGRRVQIQLLGAPNRGGGKFLVETWLEENPLRGQVFLRLPQRLVVAAQGTASVAADEAGGVETGHRVALALQHGQSDQRLDTAHEGAAGLQRVFVVQANRLQRAQDISGQRGVHGASAGHDRCESMAEIAAGV